MGKLLSIDTENRLYVLREGKGYSCLGWDVLDARARAAGEWLRDHGNTHSAMCARTWLAELEKAAYRPGTEDHWQLCENLMGSVQTHCSVFGVQCPVDLVPALVGLEGKRVEADYFDKRIRFNVGRSTGWLPVHLLLHRSTSRGGEGLIAKYIANVRVVG